MKKTISNFKERKYSYAATLAVVFGIIGAILAFDAEDKEPEESSIYEQDELVQRQQKLETDIPF